MSDVNLMITCHPDDESLFGWGHLKQDKWHVICVTGLYTERGSEFKHAISTINTGIFGPSVTGELWGYKDEWDGGFPEVIEERIAQEIKTTSPKSIVTHNAEGEYKRHTQHLAMHQIVKSAAKKAGRDRVFVFTKGKKLEKTTNLIRKCEALAKHKSQLALDAFDWYDQEDPNNNLRDWILYEHELTEIRL